MRKTIILFVTVFSILIMVACDGNSNSNVNEVEANNNNESESENNNNENDLNENEVSENDEYYFDGKVAEIRDVKVEIKETKVIPAGEEGNEYGDKPVFAIWYDATNKTDEEIDAIMVWLAIFTAVQDNDPNMVNELGVGDLPDDAHLDTQTNNIKKDGTVENSVSYELDDEETPVTLIATQGVGGDEIGREDYEIK